MAKNYENENRNSKNTTDKKGMKNVSDVQKNSTSDCRDSKNTKSDCWSKNMSDRDC